jgi:hypothetical protein
LAKPICSATHHNRRSRIHKEAPGVTRVEAENASTVQ